MSEVKVDPVIVTIEREDLSCDRCVMPGACCHDITLNHAFEASATKDDVTKWLHDVWLPFIPLRPNLDGHNEADNTLTWRFTCPRLGENGRCTIYQNRPEVCRIFEPGSDALCVHFRGKDGAPIIPQIPIVPTIESMAIDVKALAEKMIKNSP